MTTKSKSRKGRSKKGVVCPILSKADALNKNLKNLGLSNIPYLVAIWNGEGLEIRHNINDFEIGCQKIAWLSLSAAVMKGMDGGDA